MLNLGKLSVINNFPINYYGTVYRYSTINFRDTNGSVLITIHENVINIQVDGEEIFSNAYNDTTFQVGTWIWHYLYDSAITVYNMTIVREASATVI